MYMPGTSCWLICLMIGSYVYALPPTYPMGDRPHYIDCLNDNECGRDECCVIGSGRYTIPTCRKRQDISENCRPNDKPTSVNLTYPEGTRVELRDVHYNLCPCQAGLHCSSKTGVCQDPMMSTETFNYLDDMY